MWTYLTNMFIAVTAMLRLMAFQDLVSPYNWRASSGHLLSTCKVPVRNDLLVVSNTWSALLILTVLTTWPPPRDAAAGVKNCCWWCWLRWTGCCRSDRTDVGVSKDGDVLTSPGRLSSLSDKQLGRRLTEQPIVYIMCREVQFCVTLQQNDQFFSYSVGTFRIELENL